MREALRKFSNLRKGITPRAQERARLQSDEAQREIDRSDDRLEAIPRRAYDEKGRLLGFVTDIRPVESSAENFRHVSIAIEGSDDATQRLWPEVTGTYETFREPAAGGGRTAVKFVSDE